MASYHLAQINIAQAIDDLESERMKGFVDRLDEINALADHANGFVWRLQTNQGDATSIQAYDNSRIIVNLSVWKDIESLRTFVYETAHIKLLQGKRNWFRKSGEQSQAMWWVPAGTIPTVDEGKQKLAIINLKGPTQDAFKFSGKFPAPA